MTPPSGHGLRCNCFWTMTKNRHVQQQRIKRAKNQNACFEIVIFSSSSSSFFHLFMRVHARMFVRLCLWAASISWFFISVQNAWTSYGAYFQLRSQFVCLFALVFFSLFFLPSNYWLEWTSLRLHTAGKRVQKTEAPEKRRNWFAEVKEIISTPSDAAEADFFIQQKPKSNQ